MAKRLDFGARKELPSNNREFVPVPWVGHPIDPAIWPGSNTR
jgi:hypothetical protein